MAARGGMGMEDPRMEKGKVWLLGAGPGDAGLLTVKGKSLLEEADVVVYDHLAGREILASIPAGKDLINVGKIAGHHPIPQPEINQILIREAQKGQRVVRLKGGDPFLFGRGGEELEALAQEGIPFEVVPGVSSALAVPAYGGIPVTHRDYASSLHIITGHKRKGGENGCDYRALVQAGGTLVFLMGVTALPRIVEGLLEAGMSAAMPAAVVQEGTTARQKRVVSSLSELPEAAKREEIAAPAIIVVGEVCRLAGTIGWYEKLPLAGIRVLVTRPRELVSTLSEKLRKKGAEVLEIPAIYTETIREDKLRDCIQNNSGYDWVVFTSQIGVREFFAYLKDKDLDIRRFWNASFAVIGEGTARALLRYGIRPDLMPRVYDGESLATDLIRQGVKGKQILIPRALEGNEKLVPMLEEAGAQVDDVAVYRTRYAVCEGIDLKQEINEGRIDYVTFTSSSTVQGFAAVSEGADYQRFMAVCIGRQTEETAKSYGMRCVTAEKASIDSLTECIERIERDR